MDPREELAALRRMAELEAKASGTTTPDAPAATKPTASTGDIIAGLPATRMLAGVVSPVVGAFQVGANIGDWINGKIGQDPVLGPWIAEQIAAYDQSKKRGMEALGNSGPDLMGIAGSALTGGIGLKGIAPAATYLGKVAQGATVGAVAGATTPSSTPGIAETGKQAAVGTALGGVVPAVTPVLKAGYHVIEPMFDKGQAAIKQRALVEAAGDRGPQVLNALRDPSQNILPGSLPTAGEAAVPAGSVEFSALQKSASKAPGAASEYLARADATKSAQINQLRTVGRTEADLVAAEASRDANALVNYAAANNAGIDQGMAAALKPQIQDLMTRPVMLKLKKDTVKWAADNSIATPNFGSVEGLDYLKKSLDRQIKAAAAGNDAKAAADLVTLMKNKEDLLFLLKDIAPAYDSARAAFAAQSVPVNQMRVGQYLENKLVPALGEDGKLRAASFAGAVKDAPGTIQRSLDGSPRFQKLTSILDKPQMDAVQSVVDDLARGARFEDMAKFGGPTANAMNLATESIGGGGSGKLPGLLSRAAAVANMLIARAEGRLDKKLALELAKEMLSPAATANSLEKGLASQATSNSLAKARLPVTAVGVQASTNAMQKGK
jgi:hypothetical protein